MLEKTTLWVQYQKVSTNHKPRAQGKGEWDGKLTVKTPLFGTFPLLMLLDAVWADVGGKITGVVKDQTDAVIAGATVAAVSTATGVKKTTKTDEQGSYAFPVLSVGQY